VKRHEKYIFIFDKMHSVGLECAFGKHPSAVDCPTWPETIHALSIRLV
jgi:hypothetical protein